MLPSHKHAPQLMCALGQRGQICGLNLEVRDHVQLTLASGAMDSLPSRGNGEEKSESKNGLLSHLDG